MIADSSSAESGMINIGDILLSVDGHGVAGNSIEDIIQMIRCDSALVLPKTNLGSVRMAQSKC